MYLLNNSFFSLSYFTGTDECPVKSVVNRVATQLERALHEKGLAFLVNHGISEEKVKIDLNND